MKVLAADALILRTYRYGEADRIVVFLTVDHGKKRGVAKNASKSRRRFGGALEPLTRGRAHYVEREGRELVRLDRIEPKRSPMQTSTAHEADPASVLAHASYFAELLDEWSPENAANDRLFRLGAGVGDALGRGGSMEALARYFEYWLLKLEGVYPAIADTDVSAEAQAFLTVARRMTPRQVIKHPVGRRALREVERMHQRMIAMHLEKELKSARIVRELRQDL
ncbi:MAG: DNA repair protein RecO [Acidobacteria bacterium]|nr:MAG: DNA repair protein RecO [Acidobacteriota bacterium]